MVNKSPQIEKKCQQLREAFHKRGLKLTSQRLEVFRTIIASTEHPDAESIFKQVRKKLPAISLDTVYRTLWMLMEKGLITTLGHGQKHIRFEPNMDPHHHFICSQCGRATDFVYKAFDRLPVPVEVRRQGRIDRIQVEFRGLCKTCAPKRG